MKTEKSQEGNIVLLLDEKFDFSSVGEFRNLYESLTGINNKEAIIDFKNTRYIDSSALGMLINAKGHFDREGAKVKIKNTNDQIKKIFSISRFDTKFDIS